MNDGPTFDEWLESLSTAEKIAALKELRTQTEESSKRLLNRPGAAIRGDYDRIDILDDEARHLTAKIEELESSYESE